MDDLISRQAAIDALVEEIAYKPEGYWDSGLNQYDVEVVLNQQPSIDAVEVVRCKDCRYFNKAFPLIHLCNVSGMKMETDDYCSYGERKEQ